MAWEIGLGRVELGVERAEGEEEIERKEHIQEKEQEQETEKKNMILTKKET